METKTQTLFIWRPHLDEFKCACKLLKYEIIEQGKFMNGDTIFVKLKHESVNHEQDLFDLGREFQNMITNDDYFSEKFTKLKEGTI